jgi:hypothetical protein
MKKSLIGLGVIAAMAVGGAANAAFWSVTNAQVDGVAVVPGGTVTMQAAANVGWLGGGTTQTSQALAGGNLTSVQGLVGSVLADDTITYFSFSAGSLGYFGVAYKNTAAGSVNLGLDFTRTNQATEGVYVAGATTTGSYDATGLGQFSSSQLTINSGNTLYVVLGGFTDQNSPPLQGTINANADTNIQYLSFNGSAYSSVASGNGLTSNMQFAVFTIPVPAPALLAGLGLVGALALRRRMK